MGGSITLFLAAGWLLNYGFVPLRRTDAAPADAAHDRADETAHLPAGIAHAIRTLLMREREGK